VFERLLTTVAIAVSLVVVASFVLFAVDELNGASSRNQAKLTQDLEANPPPAAEQQRERDHGAVREAIDDANDVLVSPFDGIVSNDDSRWAQRGVPALLALLVFGFGLGFLARFSRGRA
jgi:hypothetical protein